MRCVRRALHQRVICSNHTRASKHDVEQGGEKPIHKLQDDFEGVTVILCSQETPTGIRRGAARGSEMATQIKNTKED